MAVFGLWGFVVCLAIVNEAAGFWGVVIGFILLPATFVIAPWYALIAHGYWVPLAICYGGGITSAVFMGIGLAIAGE